MEVQDVGLRSVEIVVKEEGPMFTTGLEDRRGRVQSIHTPGSIYAGWMRGARQPSIESMGQNRF